MGLDRVLRTMLKHKTSTLFSIVSLFITFLGIIVLVQYVSFQSSFDKFHENSESLYRLETLMYADNTSTMFGKIIDKNIPEVEDVVYVEFSSSLVSLPEQSKNQKGIETSLLYTDQNFFTHFSFPVLEKSADAFLSTPNSIALTQSYAANIFNGASALGQTILLNDVAYQVTAIVKDFPDNSSIQADAVSSLETFRKDESRGIDNWSEWSYGIYLKLSKNADPQQVCKKIAQLPDIAETLKMFMAEYEGQDFFLLNSLSKIHFINSSNYITANIIVLKVLVLLAILLALMGIFNFVNFSTSQAFQRVRTVSIFQVYGAKRFSAIKQFFLESVMLSVFVLLVSLLVYVGLYSFIESLFGINGLSFTNNPINLIWFVLFSIAFGIVAAIYPSIYISSAKISDAIKGKPKFVGKGRIFRSTLVVLQFVFTIALIISAVFIEKQLKYWQNYNVGINKEHVVLFNTTEDMRNSADALVVELLKNKDIVDYTYSQFAPGNVWMGWGRMVNEKHVQIKCWPVDKQFINFFGIEIVQGRSFQTHSDADINNFIVNEKAVADFNWDKPLENKMSGFDFEGDIVGVAKDFNFSDLKTEIQPMQLWLTDTRKNVLMLRLKTNNYQQTFKFIKSTAEAFDSKSSVDVKFLDAYMNKLYGKEIKTSHFIQFITLWCILLALTGMLGLVVFKTRARVKEIGVRKVNGATIFEIMRMLNINFVVWVALAFVLASPIAYFAVNKWLQNFAYKTSISWWVFAFAGIFTLVMALLTVSFQTFKAARYNPVKALRYE